jgi:hypothetical protein
VWTGARNAQGYAYFKLNGKTVRAHCLAYQDFNGSVPEGLDLDHLCRNRSCVNPDHLEPVTHTENIRRGDTVAARNAAKTHCSNGHELSPDNVYRAPLRPNQRVCRKCLAVHLKERRRRRRLDRGNVLIS